MIGGAAGWAMLVDLAVVAHFERDEQVARAIIGIQMQHPNSNSATSNAAFLALAFTSRWRRFHNSFISITARCAGRPSASIAGEVGVQASADLGKAEV